MDPVIEPSVRLMTLNASLLEQAVAGLSDDQLWASPGEHSNPIIWILGHVTVSRAALVGAVTGVPLKLPWFGGFRRGAARADRAQSPPISEIQRGMQEVSAKLTQALQAATSESLSRACAFDVPASDGTMRGLIAFVSFHESYHVGQAGYVRKWLGFPGMVG
jgi:uncharacterized damage-inducible protein DinB